MSYEIDTLNLITASFSGFYLNVDQHGYNDVEMFDSNGNLLYSYMQSFGHGQQYKYSYMNGRLDYQHLTDNKGEAINFSYLLSSSNTGNKYDSKFEELVNPQFDYISKDIQIAVYSPPQQQDKAASQQARSGRPKSTPTLPHSDIPSIHFNFSLITPLPGEVSLSISAPHVPYEPLMRFYDLNDEDRIYESPIATPPTNESNELPFTE